MTYYFKYGDKIYLYQKETLKRIVVNVKDYKDFDADISSYFNDILSDWIENKLWKSGNVIIDYDSDFDVTVVLSDDTYVNMVCGYYNEISDTEDFEDNNAHLLVINDFRISGIESLVCFPYYEGDTLMIDLASSVSDEVPVITIPLSKDYFKYKKGIYGHYAKRLVL